MARNEQQREEECAEEDDGGRRGHTLAGAEQEGKVSARMDALPMFVVITAAELLRSPDVLYTLRPRHVVLHDGDLTVIRQLERYQQALRQRTEDRLAIYYLVQEGCTEEYQYKSKVQREKHAFEQLLEINAHMVVCLPDAQSVWMQAKREDQQERLSDSRSLARTPVSRGGTLIEPPIVIDIREFRSFLPNILHASGAFTLVPETIYVRCGRCFILYHGECA